MKYYAAVDLGASSGRVILGTVANEKIELQEMHRFENGPVVENGSLHWDFNKLMGEIKAGLKKAFEKQPNISAIGVDTWGVDYGLLDKGGNLIENPYNYRDSRTDNAMPEAFAVMPQKDIYGLTGIQFMQLNTIFQLFACTRQRPQLLEEADKLIFMADLVSYFLCGEKYAEYTLASTSQLLNMKTGEWAKEIFEKLGIPLNIMPDIVQPGTIVGKLQDSLCKELGCKAVNVVAVGSHDTACAVTSVPASDGKWAYLSSGTWSLMGVEAKEPVINETTFEYEFTNEGGVYNTIRLLKNIMGLWLVQQCRQTWKEQGYEISFAKMTEMAEQAKPFAGFINPNDSKFLAPGDMAARVNEYLAETNQPTTEDKGEILRIIQESLAFCYKSVLDKLEKINNQNIDVLHIVGGGIQNEFLCQLTADAIGKKVLAGPVEATACGNILLQAIADGEVADLKQARKIVANSFELKEYLPENTKQWQEQYENYLKYTG